jgi:hypothetical protein
MTSAKIVCLCGKQVSFIRDIDGDLYSQKGLERAKSLGFRVFYNVEPSEQLLQPCRSENCPFSKTFSTKFGFNDITKES